MNEPLSSMNSFTDYYTLLGVAVNAEPEEIKAAFKKLALQYHPDVYKGSDAQERMRLLLQAYKTLNNPSERKRYDLQLAEHVDDGYSPRFVYEQNQHTTASSGTMQRQTRTQTSTGARRDRERHYAFPDFPPSQSVNIDLVDVRYTLPPAEARSLVQAGMLRGVMAKTEDGRYYCHRCHYRWYPDHADEQEMPRYCPKCLAADWSEYLLLRCLHCCAVFESEQIRYEIGTYAYGKGHSADLCPPYELFPLCPYCGTARWSPAEDIRVSELRLRVARRSSRLHLLLLALAIAAVVLIAFMALGVIR